MPKIFPDIHIVKCNTIRNKALNIFERELLSNYENDFDAFDKFFFASLKYCFPKIFIEDYENIEIFLKNKIEKYAKYENDIEKHSSNYLSIEKTLEKACHNAAVAEDIAIHAIRRHTNLELEYQNDDENEEKIVRVHLGLYFCDVVFG